MSFSLDSNAHELVKVVARVRPVNACEKAKGETTIVETEPDRNEVLVAKPKDKNAANSVHSSFRTEIKPFTFDAVIDNSMSERQIYDKVFRSLVNSAVEGFNGTIFAYGQTGTGKTFTMEGSLDSDVNYGVMPNAFKHIFDQVAINRDKRYLIGVSYFEIYQEEIRDLLDIANLKKCTIHENPNGGIYIKGLSSYLCSNFQEISELMLKGKASRAVGATNMNEHSSRSHAVFQVTIETFDQADVQGEHIKVGKLNLVDLAGSERVSKTGAEGQRLKEASKINLSLSSLGNVISALVDGAPFIPYRDSKLTRILQDSLGGNSRTVMVATVGPVSFNYEETMNTLRYACRAKNIKNKPRLNENPKDAVLRKYQDEINRLRYLVEEQKTRKNSASRPSTAAFDESGRVKSKRQIQSDNEQKRMIQIMDMSKINELTEMLEPLGITFEGDIEAIRAKLKEKTESLEKDTLMVKEQKETLSKKLQKAIVMLQSEEYECKNLTAQITWLESKVLNSPGEHNLLQRMKSQKEQIELKVKELESHKMRQEHLKKVLAEKEMTNEEAFATSNALENDNKVSLEKLKKITRKMDTFAKHSVTLRKRHGEDVGNLKNCIRDITEELKLKKTIVDNFVPRKIRKDIDQRMRYDIESDQYFVEPPKSTDFGPPKVDNMLYYPLINLTRFRNLQPMENTFFTNENVLLLGPDIPFWPSSKFVEDNANPRVESLIKRAIKDINNTIIINCDHKGSKFRIGRNDTPSYTAVGSTLLLKHIRSDKFTDFAVVPPDINLPSGSNICPIKIPPRLNGAKFTQQQLLAFPLLNYSAFGELSFEDISQSQSSVVSKSLQKVAVPSSRKNKYQCLRNVSRESGKRPQNTKTNNILCDMRIYDDIQPEQFLCHPKTSIPSIDFRTLDTQHQNSDDPSMLEMGNGMTKSTPKRQEDKVITASYSDEERMLQRLHYFASRKAHTSQEKNPEFDQISTSSPHLERSSTASVLTNPNTVRVMTSVKPNCKISDKTDNDSYHEARQQRNLENSSRPITSRPPSRKHKEFSDIDS